MTTQPAQAPMPGRHSTSRRLRRALPIAALAVLASAAVALAAHPIKGRTYTGTLAHGHVKIVLKVSKSGRSVIVTAPYAPVYCGASGAAERAITSPVPISAAGKFSGTITYEFAPTHAKLSHLVYSGTFSGRTVAGVARSEFLIAAIKGCDGSTSFSAKAKKK